MEGLWGADHATGSGVRIARQVRQGLQTQGFSVNLNEDHVEYISEPPTFDHDTEEPFPSPPVVDSHSPTPTESTPSAPSGGTSSSRGSKRKAPLVDLIDSQFAHLTTKLDVVTDAMRQGNDNVDRLSSITAEHNAIFHEHVQNWHRHSSVHYSEREI